MAFHALTDAKSHNTDHLILGPELFSYTEVAELISEKLGRKITQVDITEQQFADGMKGFVAADYADMLAKLETAVREGQEERLNDVVLKVTGKKPRGLGEYVDEMVAKGVWVGK